MERAMIWFKCAAMHDPVRPVIDRPATLGWKAKERAVDLKIERYLKGDELLRHMKGWFTADVHEVIEVVKKYGRLTLLDDYDLVVETRNDSDMESIANELKTRFNEEVWIEPMTRRRL